MTKTSNDAAVFEERDIPLRELAIAPENPRASEPADDGVAYLAETLFAAGVLHPLIVRPGRKGEKPGMILSGRRRYLGLQRLLDAGRIQADYLVRCKVAGNKAAELAGLFISNEHVPVHVADVIAAIGKLRKTRLDSAAIAAALAYDELEIRRLQALSSLHPLAIQALREGRITLKQARLLARLPDRKDQAEFARQALEGYMQEWVLHNRVSGRTVTTEDPRFALVGRDRYLAAGGRLSSDLFGELPDVVLDPEILETAWRARIQPCVQTMIEAGLAVFLAGAEVYHAPDGYELPPYVYVGSMPDEQAKVVREASEAVGEASEACDAADPASDERLQLVGQLLLKRLARSRALHPALTFAAAILHPEDGGLGVLLAVQPVVESEESDAEGEAEEDELVTGGHSAPPVIPPRPVVVDVTGRSHALHQVYTDAATRGLIADLAAKPAVALVVLVAQLFADMVLHDGGYREPSALKIKAARYPAKGVIAPLDGEVRSRLVEARAAYLAAGERPIAWVAGLGDEERLALLADLVASSLDLKESRTSAIQAAARAEAADIAERVGADIARRWTPDAAFLSAHSKKQLLGLLAEMGADAGQASTLKKDALVALVEAQARERRWAPAALAWTSAGAGEDEAEPGSTKDLTEPPQDDALAA